jgi:hypothetical protein
MGLYHNLASITGKRDIAWRDGQFEKKPVALAEMERPDGENVVQGHDGPDNLREFVYARHFGKSL